LRGTYISSASIDICFGIRTPIASGAHTSKISALKASNKPYTDKAYRYFAKSFGKHTPNFIMSPLNISLDYIRVLRSSKRTGWAGLAYMWRTCLKHVEEYVKLYNRALAAATPIRR